MRRLERIPARWSPFRDQPAPAPFPTLPVCRASTRSGRSSRRTMGTPMPVDSWRRPRSSGARCSSPPERAFLPVDANTGKLVCVIPAPQQPLIQNYGGNASSPGIASSATIARVWVHWFCSLSGRSSRHFRCAGSRVCAGTPPACGSGRLWALNANTGQLVWKSDVIANLTGTHWGYTTELHERIGYSSPVVPTARCTLVSPITATVPFSRRLAAVSLSTERLSVPSIS